jgi:anti-sigma factor RsiW
MVQRLDLAPPVVDLTAQGFRLIGGGWTTRGRAVAAIVYRRRTHVINLIARRRGSERSGAKTESRDNIRR